MSKLVIIVGSDKIDQIALYMNLVHILRNRIFVMSRHTNNILRSTEEAVRGCHYGLGT